VIFPDTSLREMARWRPQTEEQFLDISGVGQKKLEAFYTTFTREIRGYCEEHGLRIALRAPDMLKASSMAKSEADVPDTAPAKPKTEKQEKPALPANVTRQLSRAMFEQGLSVDEIAKRRNLPRDTIISHLAESLEAANSSKSSD